MTNIILPRSVLEQALEALDEADLLMEHRQNIELRRSALAALSAALEQPQVEQEPVAWMTEDGRVASDELKQTAMASSSKTNFNIPLYTNPQPPRQPLTPEAVNDLWIKHARSGAYIHAFARAIERAHGIGGEA